MDVAEKEGYDSRKRARWRDRWFAISLFFLGIGAIAAVSEQLSKEASARDLHTLGRELVATTIDEMKPDRGEDLKPVQGLLHDVLLKRHSVDNAVKEWSPGTSHARQLQLLTTARVKFRADWGHVLATLTEYLAYLEPTE